MAKVISAPLGVSRSPLAREVIDAIEMQYPALWRLMERYPLRGGIRELTAADFVELGMQGRNNADEGGISAVYSYSDDSIEINRDAKDDVDRRGGFGTFSECLIWKNKKLNQAFGNSSLSQARKGDFYVVVTIHELGHHFESVAREDEHFWAGFARVVGKGMTLSMLSDRAISGYATLEIAEYWAENFAAYWVMPDALKECDPAAFLMMGEAIKMLEAPRAEAK